MIFGEIFIDDGEYELNVGCVMCLFVVVNIGDCLVQVGLYYYFFEVNDVLLFDCVVVCGFWFNIVVGMVVCFEFGQMCIVEFVVFVGECVVYGFQGKVMGLL